MTIRSVRTRGGPATSQHQPQHLHYTENIHYTSLNAVLVGTEEPSCECVNVSVAKYEL